MKYNLTFWQKFFLPLIWLLWAATDPDKRRTWHEVKKGMEHHTCEWEELPYEVEQQEFYNYIWYKCKHEGCNTVHPVMERTANGIELDKQLEKYRTK